MGLPKDVSSEIAYERKKQRAKDARVKLNEAIEELALSIDLAGSQSKERYNYIVKTTNCVNVHVAPSSSGSTATSATAGTGAAGAGGSGAPPPQVPQHPLAKLMDETIQQTSDAKKWDRPSFVGLSATIIRNLNAQCEGLMREVAQLRNLARSQMTTTAGGVVDKVTSACGGVVVPLQSTSSPVGVNGVHPPPPPPPSVNGGRKNPLSASASPSAHGPNAAKKQKIDNYGSSHTNNTVAINT